MLIREKAEEFEGLSVGVLKIVENKSQLMPFRCELKSMGKTMEQAKSFIIVSWIGGVEPAGYRITS